ncbi:MAG: alanine dehydrogenase [Bacteroidia bacterium]
MSQVRLEPQAQKVRAAHLHAVLKIGIPKEKAAGERRVSLVPSSVRLLVAHGHEVYLESGSGRYAHFSDREYAEAGAQIVYNAAEIYQKADVIVKIAPLTAEEVHLLRSGQVIFSAVHLGTLEKSYLDALLHKGAIAIGYEFLQAKDGSIPIMRMMSEIAGKSSIIIAGELLSQQGRGVLLGGITGKLPPKVMILGAGTVGLHAARVALALGCQVQVFDEEIYRLQRLQILLGQPVHTSLIQPDILFDHVGDTEVLIGALYRKGEKAHLIITEEMVQRMRPGSIIIDVVIDQGGNVETSHPTTHEKPIYTVHDVVHYCVPNIPSRVPRTASEAMSQVLTPLLLRVGEAGGLRRLLASGHMLRTGVYTFQRHLTNRALARLFNMDSIDIELLVL